MAPENRQKKTFKYLCEHCGYKTNRKWSFDYHLNRKKPCKPKEIESTNDNTEPKIPLDLLKNTQKPTCKFCDKSFSRTDSLKRHFNTCKAKKATASEDNGELKELREEIEKLKTALKEYTQNLAPDIHKRNQGFPERMKKIIAAEQGWKCNVCDITLPANYQVDHALAISFGGSNHRTNGQALCVECHKNKTKAECKKRKVLKNAGP
jgi:hypothetical protein